MNDSRVSQSVSLNPYAPWSQYRNKPSDFNLGKLVVETAGDIGDLVDILQQRKPKY